MARMRIGTLAKAAGCPAETVRFYERAGLLPAPARSAGNYRLYGSAALERLRFIRHCRLLDMTHAEIRTLLALRDAPGDCAEVNALLDAHIDDVARRMARLRNLQIELRQLRSRCTSVQSTQDCGIIRELAGRC